MSVLGANTQWTSAHIGTSQETVYHMSTHLFIPILALLNVAHVTRACQQSLIMTNIFKVPIYNRLPISVPNNRLPISAPNNRLPISVTINHLPISVPINHLPIYTSSFII